MLYVYIYVFDLLINYQKRNEELDIIWTVVVIKITKNKVDTVIDYMGDT